ncbi:TPA: GAF domain-containing protein [Klebsiella pneumoniae]|nr:GAF domain-containing protein [Klebsiella pneumoniae]HBV1861026.1 GAF domain-containing protein [Klebsiella pneumoniae]HBV1897771.1 GAF domain-containing protein [Klebsiella pneumoniae]
MCWRRISLFLDHSWGNIACARIPVGSGVCGTAVAEERILCINNVHSFNGHIVCDTASNSEIVLPVRINNTVVGALDIDSPAFSRFSSEDEL